MRYPFLFSKIIAMFRAEKVRDGVVIATFEEDSDMVFSEWELRAVKALRPRGELIRYYIDGVEQFGNW